MAGPLNLNTNDMTLKVIPKMPNTLILASNSYCNNLRVQGFKGPRPATKPAGKDSSELNPPKKRRGKNEYRISNKEC
jgi:hypothetical protein